MTTAASRLPFVGRGYELQVLRQALAGAESGTLTAVFLEGEAGIGKSRLLHEVLAPAAQRGVHVLYGKSEELERTLPFGTLRAVLEGEPLDGDGERARLARPVLDALVAGRPEGVDVRYRVMEDVLDLVEKLSTTAPVAVAVDDLHWADPSTLLVVSAIARRLRHLPVALFGTYRPVPASDDLVHLVEALSERGARRVTLEALGEREAESLAASVLGSPVTGEGREVLARAAGNPLLVIELARSLGSPGSAADELRPAVLRRLEHLSPVTRDLLQVASTLGTTFEVSQLALVVGRSAVELLPSLEEARRAAILGEAGGRLAFRHDLVREAIYESIPTSIRRALHLDTGRTLARSGVPPLEVAEHLVQGASKGDAEAVAWLCDAGRAAADRSAPAAVALFEAALALADPSDPQRDSVVAAMLSPLTRCGRLAEAETLARDALARATDPSTRDALRLSLVAVLNRQDRITEQLRECTVPAEGTSPLTEIHLKLQASYALIHMGRMEEARRLVEEAVTVAERDGDEKAIFFSRAPLFSIPTWQGHLAEGVDAARRLVADERRLFAVPNIQPLAFTLAHADGLEEARDLLLRSRPAVQDSGNVSLLLAYQWRLLHVSFLSGNWDDAVAEGEAALATAQETGVRGIFFHGVSLLAEIALHRNEVERAEEYLAVIEAAKPQAAGHQTSDIFIQHARGLVSEAAGDLTTALEAMERAWETAATAGFVVTYTELGPDLVRMLVRAGDRPRAREIAAQVETSAGRKDTASARGAALRSRGLAEGDPGTLVQAVAAMRDSPRVLGRAQTWRDAGEALLSTDRAQAVELLEESIRTFEQLGAHHDVREVDAVLRSAGAARGRRGARARPTIGWEALTPTEHDVVALIAQGMTAREAGQRLFISPRTVETHIAHVFAKLGLSSRADLRAAYARRTPPRGRSQGRRVRPISHQPNRS